MVEGVRHEGLDDRDVVGDGRGVRDEFREFRAACAVARELELGAEQRGVGIDESRAVALEQVARRQRAFVLGQFGLVVEQFQVARTAAHEQEDHVLGGRLVVRPFRRQRIRRLQQLAQGDRPEADSALLQEPAARQGAGGGWQLRHRLLPCDSFVQVQKHPGHGGPCRQFGHRGFPGFGRQWRRAERQFRGIEIAGCQPAPLVFQQP